MQAATLYTLQLHSTLHYYCTREARDSTFRTFAGRLPDETRQVETRRAAGAEQSRAILILILPAERDEMRRDATRRNGLILILIISTICLGKQNSFEENKNNLSHRCRRRCSSIRADPSRSDPNRTDPNRMQCANNSSASRIGEEKRGEEKRGEKKRGDTVLLKTRDVSQSLAL